MSTPLFHIAIVSAHDGIVAKIPGGGELETDLIELIVQHILAKGVGLFKSKKHVEQDIREGVKQAIMGLKAQTRFIV